VTGAERKAALLVIQAVRMSSGIARTPPEGYMYGIVPPGGTPRGSANVMESDRTVRFSIAMPNGREYLQPRFAVLVCICTRY
jgi:hypothetical protein